MRRMKTMHILAAGALTALLVAVPAASQTADMLTLSVSDAIPRRVEIASGARTFLISPAEGLWSVATDWADGWPSGWVHASPAKVEREGEWTIAAGLSRRRAADDAGQRLPAAAAHGDAPAPARQH